MINEESYRIRDDFNIEIQDMRQQCDAKDNQIINDLNAK